MLIKSYACILKYVNVSIYVDAYIYANVSFDIIPILTYKFLDKIYINLQSQAYEM